MLVRMSYQLQDSQIVGGPNWLFTDRFDVMDKGTAPGPDGTFMAKLQSLLEDRFKLVVHTETREMPMYALVLRQRNGSLGPELHASAADCPTAPRSGLPGLAPPRPPPPPSPAAPGAAAGSGSGNLERPRCGMRFGPGTMMGGGLTMPQMARNLSQIVGGIVVDKTGLTGTYDWDLKYAPDPGLPARSDFPPLPAGAATPVIDGPSIFTALQEQLGLKLESGKEPVEVLVVDRAEQPADN
jgi:uncharacterized protein (TIGR03435 family)